MLSASATSVTVETLAGLFIAGAVVMSLLTVRAGLRFARRCRQLVTGVRSELATSATDPDWWANQRDRRSLWRAVVRAERAVAAARAAGIPTGDLGSVIRQLRTAAAAVDVGLRSGRRAPELRRQARQLTDSADQIARAATGAMAADAVPLTTRAVEAVQLELAALQRVRASH